MKSILRSSVLLILFIVVSFIHSNAQTPLFNRVLISDVGSNNNIGNANTSRNLAITNDGTIYAVYVGTEGIRVSKSTNRGQSFLPSVQVSAITSTEPEIAVNSEGIVFISWAESGEAFFSRSIDQGVSFSSPINLGTVGTGGFGSTIHMTTFGKNVYLRDRRGSNFFRNNNNGNGAFIQSILPRSDVFSDVRTDVNGVVHLPSDNPTLYLFNSKDNGSTTQEITLIPRGRVFFSSYALSDSPAGTFIFVAGNGSEGYKIEAETGVTTLINFKTNNSNNQGRTLFADNFGALVDGYRDASGNIKMSISYDQGITFSLDINIDGAVSHNIERNPLKDDLDIIYEIGGQIYMDVFDGLLRSVKITEPSTSFNLCQGDISVVPFTLTGAFIDNSEFFLFLSDENGSFENKTQIGFIDSKVDGEIAITIPNTIVSSDKYRLQIQSPKNFLQSNIIPIEIGSSIEIGTVDNITKCDSGDGTATFSLPDIDDTIEANTSGAFASYFKTKDNAIANISPIINTVNYKTKSTTIWVRLDSGTSKKCPTFDTAPINLVVISPPNMGTDIEDLKTCDDTLSGSTTDGFATFDLNSKTDDILKSEPNFEIVFYTDSLRNNSIADPENFANTIKDRQTIYVIISSKGELVCPFEAEFDIVVTPLPVLKQISVDLFECDEDSDGTSTFDLNESKEKLSNNFTSENFKFYTTALLAENAISGTEIINPETYSIPSSSDGKIYSRIENDNNCFRTAEINLKIESTIKITKPSDIQLCDSGDGTANFNLNSLNTIISGSVIGTKISYFITEDNANSNLNPISNIVNYNSKSATIWARLDSGTITKCPTFAITSFDLIVRALPDIATTIEDLKTCDNSLSGSDTDGFSVFNLNSKIDEILKSKDAADFDVEFYSDNLRTTLISTPEAYINAVKDIQPIYVTITEKVSLMCSENAEFNIVVTPLPSLIAKSIVLKQCDDNTDGISPFNLNEANELLSINFIAETFKYYTSLTLAENGLENTEILNSNSYNNPTAIGSMVYARIENENNCFRTAEVELQVGVSNIPQAFFDALDIRECDDGLSEIEYIDGITSFNITNVKNSVDTFFSPLRVTTTFYETPEDALSEENQIVDIINYRNSTPKKQRIYVRVDGTINNDCQGFGNFEINVDPLPLKKSITDIVGCGISSSTYDLTKHEIDEIIDGQADILVSYFKSIDDRNNNSPISNPSSYTSEPQTIYVSALNTVTGCTNIDMEFDLLLDNITLSTPLPLKKCNLIVDTVYNLTSQEDFVANRDIDLTFEYFENNSELLANNPIPDPINYTNNSLTNTIIIKATNENNCISTTRLDLITTLFADINLTPSPIQSCDFGNDGFEIFNLSGIENDILMGITIPRSEFVFTYYSNLSDAENKNNTFITNNSSYRNSTQNEQTIYVRVEQSSGECFKVVPFIIKTITTPIISIEPQYILCSDNNNQRIISTEETTLSQLPIDTKLSETNFSFRWFTGSGANESNLITLETSSTYLASTPGVYTVEVTDTTTPLGCKSFATTEVLNSFIAESISVNQVSGLFSDNTTIEINIGGKGTYEYSEDNENWQSSNLFTNVVRGESTFYIRDIYNCSVLSEEITIVDFPRFFTPNNDGYNDTWTIESSDLIQIASIQIFNRYGKLLKQLIPNSEPWDGTYIGTPLPSDDYWFVVEYLNSASTAKKQFKSRFTLKR